MRFFFITLLIFITAISASSGIPGKVIDKRILRAEELYRSGSFGPALVAFLEVYPLDSLNSRLCYRIGDCFLKTGGSSTQAEYYLRQAVRKVTSETHLIAVKRKAAPLEAFDCLGDACHLNSNFLEAVILYEKYLSLLKTDRIHDSKQTDLVQRKIQICRQAEELVKNPVDVKITNLGSTVNSSFPDYAPRLTADSRTMVYTSRRPENTGGKTYDGGKYFEDIFVSKYNDGRWSNAINFGEPVNTVGNEAAIAISADGQELLLYKDDLGDGNIYSSKLRGENWSVPRKLNANINSKFWEPCACLSADGNTLYFVSDRPGGFGGTDIYKSSRKPGGDWEQAVNLGPTINTPFDEYSPFLHPDGQTLYFSSRGHKGMGGYDVFFSRTLLSDANAWLLPVNVGFPINSPGDDVFYSVTADKQMAYFSSSREGGLGEKDNYALTFKESTVSPITIVKGKIQSSSPSVIITISDNQTQKVLNVLHTNSKTGDYIYVLTPGRSYNITYETDGALFYSDNKYISYQSHYHEVNNSVSLSDIAIGSKVILNNLFFDFDKTEVRPNSTQELERIYNFLHEHSGLKVELTGFTDVIGNDAYNRRLSLARAGSVVKYLVERGISSERLSAKGSTNHFSTDDIEKHKVSGNAGRLSDRRVELKILALN